MNLPVRLVAVVFTLTIVACGHGPPNRRPLSPPGTTPRPGLIPYELPPVGPASPATAPERGYRLCPAGRSSILGHPRTPPTS